MMKLINYLAIIILAYVNSASANQSVLPDRLSMQQRANLIDTILEERIKTVLPQQMRKANIDMWLVISREYNEDPVIKTFLPANWLSARRRTILLMHDPSGKENDPIETLAVARYAVGTQFKKAWDKEQQPDQWQRLVELIIERDPKTIAINQSERFGLADGINLTDYQKLISVLPKKYQDRIVSAEKLAIGWLETRSQTELDIYPHIVAMAHNIIADAFSRKVIKPGITTTDDVAWWMRDRVTELGMTVWFHPSVSVQRKDNEKFDHIQAFSKGKSIKTIIPGDLVHVDFGITYLRLNTDTQQHAYVLKACESDAPKELKLALKDGNRLQDILTTRFKVNKTGNQVLKEARKKALKQNIKPSIYSHPIGFHGHAAGAAIGMWDNQNGLPNGDYALSANTAYSIELNAARNIKSWNKEIRIMLEEDAIFDGERVYYINGRQTNFHLIGTSDQHQGSVLGNQCIN
ncbi:MAG: M24 family metallopeptidase [Kangiellaceae bacterium]|jgi:hypothetical protein|nr:M24 family metallopeptidase [Kangiellaceae bacterium]